MGQLGGRERVPEEMSVAGMKGEEAQAGGKIDGMDVGGEMYAYVGDEVRGAAPLAVDDFARDNVAVVVVAGAPNAATGLGKGGENHIGRAGAPEAKEGNEVARGPPAPEESPGVEVKGDDLAALPRIYQTSGIEGFGGEDDIVAVAVFAVLGAPELRAVVETNGRDGGNRHAMFDWRGSVA